MQSRIEPLTWLLAGAAALAIVFALVALSGVGGHYRLLPDDPSLASAIPVIPSATSHSAMGPLEAYAEAYNHPLFYPDRKPIAVHVPGQDTAPAQPLDVTLISVIMTPTLQMAIVEDPKTKESYRVREGMALGGAYSSWKLTGLSPRQATFDNGSQNQTNLDLRVFDGRGGEESTRTGLTPLAVASGAAGMPRLPVDAEPPPVPAPDADAANQPPNNPAQIAAQQAEQIRQRIEQRRQAAMQAQRSQGNKD